MPIPTRRPDDEIRDIEWRNNARADAEMFARGFTPGQVAHLTSTARAAPWITPGVVLALARGEADARTTAVAARLEAFRIAQSPGGGRPYGSQVRAGELNPGDRRLVGREREMAFEELAPRGREREQAYFEQTPPELVDARTRGLLDGEGRLRAPVANPSTFIGGDKQLDETRLANLDPKVAENMRVFFGLVSGVGERVDFVQSDDEVGYYDPKTRSWATRQAGVDTVNPFAPITNAVGGLVEGLESRRLPMLPGAPAQQQAGYDSPADVVQTGFMTLNALGQEAQGFARNIYGQAHGESVDWLESQSDLGIMMGGADPGRGLLGADPASEVARERVRREAERGQIGGHNITAGRWLANQVSDPNTKPFNLLSGLTDASVAIFADPTAVGGARAARAVEAGRVFTAAGDDAARVGLLRGTFTNAVRGTDARAWIDGPAGSAVVDAIAGEASPIEIMRRLNWKVDPADAVTLADTTNPAAVRNELLPMLGTKLRSVDDVWNGQRTFSLGLDPDAPSVTLAAPRPRGELARLLERVPGERIDLDDPWSAIREADRWMNNANVPAEVANPILDRLVRARTRNDVFRIVTDDMTDATLNQLGVKNDALRSEIVRIFRDTHAEAQRWFVDEVGHDVPVWTSVSAGGDIIEGQGPHLALEHIGRFIPLPDYREVRSLTSKYPNLLKAAPDAESLPGTLARLPNALVSSFQDTIWKPFTLLRGAWPVRVVGDEQLRMAAAGLDSMFSSPLSYVAIATGRKMGADILGSAFDEAEAFTKSMVNDAGGWLDDAPHRIRTGRWTVYRKGVHEQADYLRGWASEVVALHNDTVARTVAQSATLDDALDWFVNGTGRKWYTELRDAHPEYFAQADSARRYLETISERVRIKTGGDGDLLDAVRTGRLGDNVIFDQDTLKPTTAFRDALEGRIDDIGPDAVKGEDVVHLRDTQGSVVARGWRMGTRWMFAQLMAKPANYLSSSPAFKQFYYRRINELVPFASAEARATITEGAQAANLGRRQLRGITRHIPRPGALNAEEIDALAKGYALDQVESLLYRITSKRQVFDAMKLVFPFGEAWAEAFQVWGGLIKRNPIGIPRRFQQAIQGARGEGAGEVFGAPEGEGFFWTDSYGDERFIYPGSQWLTDAMAGVPVPMTGRVQGLSMFGEIVPGIGPVASLPVAAFLPDKPGWQRTLRNFLLPFGSITDDGDTSAMTQLLSYAPPWMRNAAQGIAGGNLDQQSNRAYMNTVMSVANYLYSTGRYDTSSTAGQQKLLDDARDAAGDVYLLRAASSLFGAPAAPKPEFLVESNDGLVMLSVLRDEYHRLQNDPEVGFENADRVFLERFGAQVAPVMQSYSREIVPGLGRSEAFGDWAKANPDLARDYPNTYGFFGPQGGDMDYAEYQRQLRDGERETITDAEWIRLVSDRAGRSIIDRARDMMPDNPTDEDLAWFADVQDAVRNEYPGFGDESLFASRADRDTLLFELGKALDDPRLRDTPVGQALTSYWQARDQVLEYAATPSGRMSGARKFEGDRQWLWEYGSALAAEHPEFRPLWERVLSREVEVEDGA